MPKTINIPTFNFPTLNPQFTWLIIISSLLLGLGLLFVFESSVAESFNLFGDPYHLVKQQLVGAGLGLVTLGTAFFIPIRWWLKASPVLFGASLLVLAAVFIPGIGLELNGARRWLNLGWFIIQPIELVKLGLILYLASWLSKHQRLAPFLVSLIPIAIILLAQPDLGSLILITTIAFGMYFGAGGQINKLGWLVAACIPLLILAIMIAPYRMQRLTTFFNPEADPLGASFQIRQITLALGRGGWWGQGLGNSHQRFAFIPEASTDSIFAITAEEVGFVGSIVILSLFLIYFGLIYAITQNPKLTKGARLVGIGILIWVSAQTALNLGAIVGLVPLTGVPLPFFSYGRSAIIMILLATGIVLRLSRKT